MTVRERLVAAREELVAVGWARGLTDWRGDGPVCGLGAIWRVTGDRETYWPVVSALARVIPAPYGADCYERITRFNDDRATTLADVLASFGRAIAREAVVSSGAVRLAARSGVPSTLGVRVPPAGVVDDSVPAVVAC